MLPFLLAQREYIKLFSDKNAVSPPITTANSYLWLSHEQPFLANASSNSKKNHRILNQRQVFPNVSSFIFQFPWAQTQLDVSPQKQLNRLLSRITIYKLNINLGFRVYAIFFSEQQSLAFHSEDIKFGNNIQ